MISRQFSQSRLRISIAIGEPIGEPGPHSREELDGVGLDLHAAAAAVALLATSQIGVDVARDQRDTRRSAFKDRDQCRAVRFAGGCESKHLRNYVTRSPVASVLRYPFSVSDPFKSAQSEKKTKSPAVRPSSRSLH